MKKNKFWVGDFQDLEFELPCKQEVGQVSGRGQELGRVEVNDVALLTLVGALWVGRPEHEVAHPHVAVADRVESGAEGISGPAELDKQLKKWKKLQLDFTFSGQSYQGSTIVNYISRVVPG